MQSISVFLDIIEAADLLSKNADVRRTQQLCYVINIVAKFHHSSIFSSIQSEYGKMDIGHFLRSVSNDVLRVLHPLDKNRESDSVSLKPSNQCSGVVFFVMHF